LQFSVQPQPQQDLTPHPTLNLLFEDPESEMPPLAMTSPTTTAASSEEPQQSRSGGVIQPMEVDDNTTTQSLLSQQHQLHETPPPPWILQLLCMCIPKHITLGLLLSSLSKLIVVLAVTVPTMERQVHGAIPIVLHDILNVTWKKDYSLTSLMETTGKAGGWDYLLMSTFSLFCVFGPLLRAILCILRRVLLSSRRTKEGGHAQQTLLDPKHSETMIKTVSTMINFMGSFCAWEVFVVAILMVQMLMPSITSTILRKPQCSLIEGSEGSCLEVEFNILHFNFWCFIVAGGLLLWMESSSSRKTTFRTTTSSRQPHRPFSYNNHQSEQQDNNIHHPYIQLEGNDTNEEEEEEDIENNVP